MKTKKTDINVIKPENQLSLFGYDDYFDLWIRLLNNQKFPNCILLTGPKGIGKATFTYHFVNSILSKGENNEYLIKKHEINKNNFSYKRIISKTHTNFFTFDNDIFNEQIKIYGQDVHYYVSNYALSAHDAIYGEQTNTTYKSPSRVVMMLDLSEQSLMLSKFGIEAGDDVTGWIAISAYGDTFGQGAEPKSGDIFQMTEYGDDRPGTRNGKFFEITQRRDQEISTINPLMGHYVWMIQAKRLDWSFEPGVSGEKGISQVYDDSFSGRLSGYTNDQTETKTYTNDADAESNKIWDYDAYDQGDDVYGDYN